MIKNFTITSITAILLSGCGGESTESTPTPTPIPEVKTLTLTVGKTTIDSASYLSRVTSTITDSTKNISIVKMNKEGTITLSGEDSTLFELIDITEGRQLAFVTKPDALSPMDTDQDGIYKVDIKAQDNDNQSATYKAAYKILIPKTTLDILNGNTYYIDLGDNKYTKITYNDSSFIKESYVNTELIEGSEETIPVTYQENSIQFVDTTNMTCLVNESSSLTLNCSTEGKTGNTKLTYLTTAPEFITPASYSLSAITANINNSTSVFAPKIAKFTIIGNAPSEDNKVIISKSKLGAKFTYKVTLDDAFHAKKVEMSLKDADRAIQLNYSYSMDKTLTYNCIFDKNNGEDKGINYTCNTISLHNSQGNADTHFEVIACNDDFTSTTVECSSAIVPVSFID